MPQILIDVRIKGDDGRERTAYSIDGGSIKDVSEDDVTEFVEAVAAACATAADDDDFEFVQSDRG